MFFILGPIDYAVVAAIALRRFGLLRTTLLAFGMAIAIQPLLPPVPCGCFRPLLRRCAAGRPYLAALKSDLKNLASQQEIYFADEYAYSANMERMGFTPSDGVTVTVLTTETGWSAWATHAAVEVGRGCGIYYGEGPISGVGAFGEGQPGELVCTP